MLRFFTKNSRSALLVSLLGLVSVWGGTWFLYFPAQWAVSPSITPLSRFLFAWIPVDASIIFTLSLILAITLRVRVFMNLSSKNTTRNWLLLLPVPLLVTTIQFPQHNLLPPTFALVLIILAFAILISQSFNMNPYSAIFRATLLFSLSSLLYFPVVVLLLVPLLALFYREHFNAQSFTLVIVGIFFPYASLFFISYLIDLPPLTYLPDFSLYSFAPEPLFIFLSDHLFLAILWFSIGVLWIISILRANRSLVLQKSSYVLARILTRWGLILMFLTLFFGASFADTVPFLAFAAGIPLARFFSQEKPKRFISFLFSLILIAIIAAHFLV